MISFSGGGEAMAVFLGFKTGGEGDDIHVHIMLFGCLYQVGI